MRRLSLIIFICIAVAAIGIGITRIVKFWGTVPANDVSSVASGIQPSQVKAFEIQSMQVYMSTGSDVKRTTDRKSIDLLLTGLKKARYPDPMPQNRVDHITLILKDGRRIGPFAFSVDREIDAFSPEFIAGLKNEGISVGNLVPETED